MIVIEGRGYGKRERKEMRRGERGRKTQRRGREGRRERDRKQFYRVGKLEVEIE